MFDYLVFKTKRLFWRMICNFIPFKQTRIRIRRARFAKIDKMFEERKAKKNNKIITLDKVGNYLPKKVLVQMNTCDNEYFITENRKIAQGGGITLIVAILNLIKIPKIQNPRLILGRL